MLTPASASTVQPGDTITAPGTYHLTQDWTNLNEGITINASNVVLDGRGHVLDGSYGESAIHVNDPGGTLTNVTVRNLELTHWSTGVEYEDVSGGRIEDITSPIGIGIYLKHTDHVTITNSTLEGGNTGIYLRYSSDNHITENDVTGYGKYGYGIKIWTSSHNNTVENNRVDHNDGDGIALYRTENTTVRNNTVSNNGNSGLRVEATHNSTITDNVATSNAEDGIYLHSTRDTLVANNTVTSPTEYGLHVYQSDRNTIRNNTIRDSGLAGVYISISEHNTIYNNYLNNTDNTAFGGNLDWSHNAWNISRTPGTSIVGTPHLGGNYWATPAGTGFSQTGTDADGDGITDTPNTLNSGNVDTLPLYREQPAPKPTEITGPITITEPGRYVLTAGAVNSTADTFISIETSDVTLDGQGHTVDGTTKSKIAIRVHNTSRTLRNVRVRNITVTHWDEGVSYHAVNGGTVRNVTLSVTNDAIFLNGSSNVTVTDNRATSSTNGALLHNSTGNTIRENTFTDNLLNGLWVKESEDNTFAQNTLNRNMRNGIYLWFSRNNTVTGNTVRNNDNAGIKLYLGGDNLIYDNLFENSHNTAFVGTSNNTWNVTKRPGQNIVGGPYVSGNHWTGPTVTDSIGTYSTVTNTTDEDLDWLGDDPWNLPWHTETNNTDHHPLLRPGGGNVAPDITIEKPGTYYLNRSYTDHPTTTYFLRISSDHVTLDGRGHTLDSTNYYRGIYAKSTDGDTLTNVTVQNLTLTQWLRGVVYIDTENSTIQNLTSDNSTDGIYVLDSTGITVSNLTANNNSDDGIAVKNSTDIRITGSNLHHNNQGIEATGTDLTITGNDATESGTGIALHATTNAMVKDNDLRVLTRRIPQSTDDIGLHITGSENVTATDNDASGHETGYLLGPFVNDSALTHNVANDTADHGLSLNHAENNLIRGNTFTNGSTGIRLAYSGNNVLERNTLKNLSTHGIRLRPDSGNNTVRDNTVTDARTGITLYESRDNTIHENTVRNNSNGGVTLSGAHRNTVTNNTLTRNDAGITFTDLGSQNNTVANNTVTRSGTVGIQLGRAGTPRFRNNLFYNNLLNNTQNVRFSSLGTRWYEDNAWNTSKRRGTSIIGGPVLGGNYWATPDGTGFSQTHNDTDGDGIAETAYAIGPATIDHLPLTPPSGEERPGRPPLPEPGLPPLPDEPGPNISYSNLTVTPTHVTTGENVTVTVDARNTGTTPGIYRAALTVNGTTVDTRTGRLPPRWSTTVTFTHEPRIPGTYDVAVNDLDPVEVTVTQPPSPAPDPEDPENGTHRLVAPFFQDGAIPGQYTHVKIQNPGNRSARVTVTFHSTDGTTHANVTLTVEPSGARSLTTAGAGGLTGTAGTQGWIEITSTRRVLSAATVVIPTRGSYEHHPVPVYNASRGSTNWTAPLYQDGALPDQYTFLAVQNPGNRGANVTLSFSAENGSLRTSHTYHVPPNHVQLVLTESRGGLTGTTGTGSVRVTSDAPVLPYGSIRESGGGEENGVRMSFRRDRDASRTWTTPFYQDGAVPGQYALLAVQNPGNRSANVTMSFSAENGSLRTDQTYVLPPKGVRTVPTEAHGGPTGTTGTGRVRITSDHPVLPHGSIMQPREMDGLGMAFYTDSDASRTWATPHYQDTRSLLHTFLAIQNPGNRSANVTLRFYGDDGALHREAAYLVPPNETTTLRTESHGGLTGTGDTSGWLAISSDTPILPTGDLLMTRGSGLDGMAAPFTANADTAPPVAAAGPDLSVRTGLPLVLDATRSTDTFGIGHYDWNLGDGNVSPGERVTHTYGSPGTHTATLTVTDHAGHSDTDIVRVTVYETRKRNDDTVVLNAPNAPANSTVDMDLPPTRSGNRTGVSLDRMNLSLRNTTDVTLTVNTSTKPGNGTPSFRVEGDGAPLLYLNITHPGLRDGDIQNVTFTFTVSKQRIRDRGLDPTGLTMHRYHDGAWNDLRVRMAGETATTYTYAVASPGLSYFALTGTKAGDDGSGNDEDAPFVHDGPPNPPFATPTPHPVLTDTPAPTTTPAAAPTDTPAPTPDRAEQTGKDGAEGGTAEGVPGAVLRDTRPSPGPGVLPALAALLSALALGRRKRK